MGTIRHGAGICEPGQTEVRELNDKIMSYENVRLKPKRCEYKFYTSAAEHNQTYASKVAMHDMFIV